MTDGSFLKITLPRRHAHIVRDGALSHFIDQVLYLLYILNLEGRPNCMNSLINQVYQKTFGFRIFKKNTNLNRDIHPGDF